MGSTTSSSLSVTTSGLSAASSSPTISAPFTTFPLSPSSSESGSSDQLSLPLPLSTPVSVVTANSTAVAKISGSASAPASALTSGIASLTPAPSSNAPKVGGSASPTSIITTLATPPSEGPVVRSSVAASYAPGISSAAPIASTFPASVSSSQQRTVLVPASPATPASAPPVVSMASSSVPQNAATPPPSAPVRAPAKSPNVPPTGSNTISQSITDLPPLKTSPVADKEPTTPDTSPAAPTAPPTSAHSETSGVTSTHSASSESSREAPDKQTDSPPAQPPAQVTSVTSVASLPPAALPTTSVTRGNTPAPPAQPTKTNGPQTQAPVSPRPTTAPAPPPPAQTTGVDTVVSSDVTEPAVTRPATPVRPPVQSETREPASQQSTPIRPPVQSETGEPASQQPQPVPTRLTGGIVPSQSVSPSSLLSSDGPKISPVNLQASGKPPLSTSSVLVSTVTDRPETTLSTPVFVSTTDSAGRGSLSLPPVFTSVSVTVEPNGQVMSITHVIANPTGIWGVGDSTSASRTGFFANTGAVAGVFLVVGIIVAAIAAVLTFALCRKRRRRFIRNSISRPLPYPENPFEDPRDTPSPAEMRYATSESSHRNLMGNAALTRSPPPGRNLLDDEMDMDVPPAPLPPSVVYQTVRPGELIERPRLSPPAPVQQRLNERPAAETMGLAGIGTARWSLAGRPTYNGPFSDYHNNNANVRPGGHMKSFSTGGAMHSVTPQSRSGTVSDITKELPLAPFRSPIMEVPSVESSPSIYPSSLPPEPAPTPGAEHGHTGADSDEDEEAIKPRPVASIPVQQPAPQIPTRSSARPRPNPPVIPPRSPLRHSGYIPEQPKQPLIIQTQVSSPQLKSHYDEHAYEPLTPPSSGSSDTAHSPKSGMHGELNPFRGYEKEILVAPALLSSPSSSTTVTQTSSSESDANVSKPTATASQVQNRWKDNFYARRKNIELRPAANVEWKS
ncbi:hypothetical protein BXZ70DRAFT_938273 [Cristinia sonorae]|uniref:Uncharacterized protein n=1 Tax=Cristinia sonorae TaxID=1940300 RepID=A0A8K0XPZ6_9AGAR|nr:hypothetical protein BXZ70DRAFT_938273 [Cristinia sonorae]